MNGAQKKLARELFGFRVHKHLGDGAQSRVYSVWEPKNHQLWAAKHVVLEDEKDQRWIDQVQLEYDIGSKLKHPAIRAIHLLKKEKSGGFGGIGGKVREIALFMELIDATPLSDIPRPTMDICIDLFRQVAEGMQHMHDKGFVHADMKPLNILVDVETWHAKIIDLGQACKVGETKERRQGTPGFMAPEQVELEPITAQTDVFNLGATMWWVLLRQHAPQAARVDAEGRSLLWKDDSSPMPNAIDSSIPDRLALLISRCLEREPHKRVKMSWVISELQEMSSVRA
jgi:serine/threonine protein kinase